MTEIKGKLIRISDTQTVSEKFAKREAVIETDGQYPQQIQIETNQERNELLDKFSVGEMVTAFINIRGRSWQNPQGETKYFNTLECWKIESNF